MNEHLKCGLDIEICEQVRVAKNYCPRIVVLNRVVKTICDYLHISLLDFPDVKNTIYIDPELRQSIEDIWHLQSHADFDELEKILAKDYVKPAEMTRFVSILCKRETSIKIYEMLAMDGYLGNDPKRYVDYLKYDDFKKVHANAVRQLYRDGLCHSPEEVYWVLQTTFGFKPCAKEEDEQLKTIYTNLVGERLDQISEWKMIQAQEELKRKESGSSKKRKLTSQKKSRKNKNPVKIPPKEESNVDFSSSFSESEET